MEVDRLLVSPVNSCVGNVVRVVVRVYGLEFDAPVTLVLDGNFDEEVRGTHFCCALRFSGESSKTGSVMVIWSIWDLRKSP